MTDSQPPHDRIAIAIGRLSMRWSHIEQALFSFCWSSASLVSDRRGGGRLIEPVFDALIGDMDARRLLEVGRRLIHQIDDDRFPNLFKDVSELFSHINDKVRNERNRWIHDVWFPYGDEVYSYDSRTTFKKVPHGKHAMLRLRKRRFDSFEELDLVLEWFHLVYRDVQTAENAINWLASDDVETEFTPLPTLGNWASVSFFKDSIEERLNRPADGFWEGDADGEDGAGQT